METRNDTMEDILTYLYCTADSFALIRNEIDIETSRNLCVDALFGEIHHLRQLCGQLSEHIQQIPEKQLEQIAAGVQQQARGPVCSNGADACRENRRI